MKKTRPLTFPKDVMNQRFWKKVDVRGPDECWEWQSAKLERGYGLIRNVHPHKPAHLFAHRVSYFLTKGDPGDLYVCHTCDNPSCVNPMHLFLGTHQDNMDDKMAKGRGGHRSGHFSLNEEETSKLCSEWLDGATYKELGERYGIGEATAFRAVKRSGLTERNVEGQRKAAERERKRVSEALQIRCGEDSTAAKLTDDIVLDMRAMHEAGVKQVEIQQKYPFCSESTVHRVVKRKNWKHLP